MSCSNYEELKAHLGHRIFCVGYGESNVSIECEDCSEVIIDYDNLEDEETNECKFCSKQDESVHIDIDDDNGNAFKICEECNKKEDWVKDY